MKRILWIIVMGIYFGIRAKKTSAEYFQLASIGVLIGILTTVTFWAILPGALLLLIFFWHIAIKRAGERDNE